MVRSGATLTRPVRSSATSALLANASPSGEDLTPAVHKIVDVWMVSVESPLRVVTALSRTSVTSVLVRTVTPNRLRSAAAWADRSGGRWPRSALPPPARGSGPAQDRLPESCPSGCHAPARLASRPTPPRRTTADDHKRHEGSAFLRVRLALGGFERHEIRRRISSASSSVFSAGAYVAQSSCPKYWWVDPGATIKVS